jgi:hypothetical protein
MSPMQKAEQQILSSAGAPGSAQGRVALLQSALMCELPKFLVEGVLENPSLSTVKDPAAAKVHSVELLKWAENSVDLEGNPGLEKIQITRPFAIHYGRRTKDGLLSHGRRERTSQASHRRIESELFSLLAIG